MTAEAVYSDPTLAALFRMILDAPFDDGPRVVMADKLEDLGESDRAEIIRVQIELAGWQPYKADPIALEIANSGRMYAQSAIDLIDELARKHNERHATLLARSAALLQLHSHTWTASLRAVLPKCTHCYGGKIHRANPDGWIKCDFCHGSGTPIGIHWSRGFPERLTGQPCQGCNGTGLMCSRSANCSGRIGGVNAAAWCGGECPDCEGEGRYEGTDGGEDVSMGPCQRCGGDWDDSEEGYSRGSGRLPGLTQAVALAMPLTGVEFQNKQPYQGSQWYDVERRPNPDETHPESDLPPALYTRLTGGEEIEFGIRSYPAASPTALLALSRAGVDLARDAAGLPKMEWK